MDNKNTTALICCFARAYHSTNYDIQIFDDYLARKLLSDSEYDSISDNMTNGILYFKKDFKGTKEEALRYIVDNNLSPVLLARSVFVETSFLIDKQLGCKQFLMFASGYDTFAYRNSDVKVYEIDMKEMLEDKIKRLKNAHIDYSNVKYIEGDLTKNTWKKGLKEKGFNPKEKTYCSLLGISYYLKKEEFYKLLKNISSLLIDGCAICFDYPTYIESDEVIKNKELAESAGEKMLSKYSIEELEKELEKYNLLVYENLNNEDVNNRFFKLYNTIKPNNVIKAPLGINYCLIVKKDI